MTIATNSTDILKKIKDISQDFDTIEDCRNLYDSLRKIDSLVEKALVLIENGALPK